MAQYVDECEKAFTTGEAIAQHLRVIFNGSTINTAGATDNDIGTMAESSFVAGENKTVRLKTCEGTHKMVASGAISAGADVFAAAGGKVSATGYVYIGQALSAASGDGSVLEVLRLPTKRPSVVLASASGAIAVGASKVAITKTGSLAALTLAAPTSAQNGTELIVFSTTAFAHTITATSLIDDGVTGGSKTTATFAAFAGAAITLLAYEGKWIVVSKNAVTVS